MNERNARTVLLVRAWEGAASDAAAWTREDRAQVTREAARLEGEQATDEAFLVRRAELALARISKADARVPRLLRLFDDHSWLPWALAALAFASGALTDAIGTSQQINLLAPPLLALILWNLAIYASRLSGRLGPLARLARRLIEAPWRKALRRRLDSHPDAGARAALGRFAADYAQAWAPLQTQRLAQALHLSAIGFAAGAVAGMYLRGLAFAYRAGWESTFLDAAQVRSFLGLLLGPASAITGIPLPDAEALQGMRLPGPGTDAAPWIHLYAVTGLLAVMLPRAVLAFQAWHRANRLAADFPLSFDAAYYAELWRARRGRQARLQVVPWGQAPSPAGARALQALADRLDAAGARLSIAAPVAYGSEQDAGHSLGDVTDTTLVIALLPATATPEVEVHGEFLVNLVQTAGPALSLAVLVDESGFVSRFGTDAAAVERREQRRRAWRLAIAGHPRAGAPVFADLERDDPASIAVALRERERPVPDSAMLAR